ncbi:MAG: glycosyltransferase family A protein [Candidatus Saganbacteria bacterium]|nr:glycosyltransferase family A protein [Candidatus Saganbacteria bacterium]
MNSITKLLFGGTKPPTPLRERRFAPLPETLPEGKLPRTSVIIPTVGRPEKLVNCLKTLSQQTLKPNEVILVDQGNLGATWIKAQIETTGLPIRWVQKLREGAASARNLGARLATGEVLFFIDDDMLLENKYLEECLKPFLADPNGEVGGVDGFLINHYTPQGSGMRFWEIFGFYREELAGQVLPNGFARKANPDFAVYTQVFAGCAAYRKAVFDSGLFYDTRNYLPGMVEDDIEFSYRVSKHFKLVTTPFARCFHDSNEDNNRNALKRGMQRAHSSLKLLYLNNELGAANFLLFSYFIFGDSLRLVPGAVTSKHRDRYQELILGRALGYLTLPWSIPSAGPISNKLAKWISRL